MKTQRNPSNIKAQNYSEDRTITSFHDVNKHNNSIKSRSCKPPIENNSHIPEFRAACLCIEDKQKNRILLIYEPYWSNEDNSKTKVSPRRLFDILAEYAQNI
jgi:hypothetical protein